MGVEETESETKELNEEEAAKDELENLGNYEQNNGESRLSWGKIRGWVSDKGNNDVAKYEVWLALPLVLMLFFAAYRCKSRRSSGPRSVFPSSVFLLCHTSLILGGSTHATWKVVPW